MSVLIWLMCGSVLLTDVHLLSDHEPGVCEICLAISFNDDALLSSAELVVPAAPSFALPQFPVDAPMRPIRRDFHRRLRAPPLV